MDAVSALLAGVGLVILAILIGLTPGAQRSRTGSASAWLSGPGAWLRRAVLVGCVIGGMEIALALALTAGESTPTAFLLAVVGYGAVLLMCGMAGRAANRSRLRSLSS